MTRDIFLKLDITEQVNLINSRTIIGLNITEVAKEISISESSIRRIMKKNNYTFNRAEKIYILSSNNIEIIKEEPKVNKGIRVEELKNNNEAISKEELKRNNTIPGKESKRNNEGIRLEEINKIYFTKEEVKELKELLAIKERLLRIVEITENNKGINILEVINMDRSNRKKATFNMDIILLDQLKLYENKSNINKSDIMNIALNEYLKKME